MTFIFKQYTRENLKHLRKLYELCEQRNYDKDYIRNCMLGLFFFKYVHEEYNSKYNQYATQYKHNVEYINRKMLRERFVLPFKNDYNTIYDNTGNPELGKIINNALIALEYSNRDKLNGLFNNIDFQAPKITKGSTINWKNDLTTIVQRIYEMNLIPVDSHENHAYPVYEEILGYWPLTTSFEGAEHYVAPAGLHDLLVKITSPCAGDRIYDPSCHIGSLLSTAGLAVSDSNNNPSGVFSLYGQTTSEEWAILTRIHMLIRGYDDAKITMGDPIRDPMLTEDKKTIKYDVLISNLPWNIENWGYDKACNDEYNRFELGVPPEGKGELAYIQHMIASASDEGRIAVIVPNGVLFREGKESFIRRNMIKKNLLEAIIALPSNLFYATKQSCTIMVLKKNKGENKNVLFIDASQEYLSDKRQNRLRESDIDKIISTYEYFRRDPLINNTTIKINYSNIITPQQIADNNFNLTVSRYVDIVSGNKKDISTATLKTEIQVLEKKLTEIRHDIQRSLIKLGLS